MSLGHHLGPHDGTLPEERLHRQLIGPGRIIVVAAGNQQADRIHFGGQFHPGIVETVPFEVLVRKDKASAIITAWYSRDDEFEGSLITPTGQALPLPWIDKADVYSSAGLELDIARQQYVWTNAIKVQIALSFDLRKMLPQVLTGWRLRLECKLATVGRVDAWFNNGGVGRFNDHALVEGARTVAMPATGPASIAVASYVSAAHWNSDAGDQRDIGAVVGRASRFSGNGPTRDGRQKPDLAAPGEYVTAALAEGSAMEMHADRVLKGRRLLTIEGTSMATPVVTGVVALMLQRRSTLTTEAALEALKASARHDAHTGQEGWSPDYGFGKIDAAEALSHI
jgi:subtilisin family serine protease